MSLNSHWFQNGQPSKLEEQKKVRLSKESILRQNFRSYFKLWRPASLEPLGVQRHNVPHFKGLIVLYLDSRSSRAWQQFYLPPRPFEKGHFREKKGKSYVDFCPWLYMIFSEAPLKYCELLKVISVAVRVAVRKHLLSRIMVIKGLIGLLLIQGKYEIPHVSFFDNRNMLHFNPWF